MTQLSDIDRLYQELFGSIPAKPGTAYEMIAAIVLGALGWQDVVHDQTERADDHPPPCEQRGDPGL